MPHARGGGGGGCPVVAEDRAVHRGILRRAPVASRWGVPWRRRTHAEESAAGLFSYYLVDPSTEPSAGSLQRGRLARRRWRRGLMMPRTRCGGQPGGAEAFGRTNRLLFRHRPRAVSVERRATNRGRARKTVANAVGLARPRVKLGLGRGKLQVCNGPGRCDPAALEHDEPRG